MPIRQRHAVLMKDRVEAMVAEFGSRLTVTTVGFGSPDMDFCVLKGMANAGRGRYFHSEGAEDLSLAINSSVASLTANRTLLTLAKAMRTARVLPQEEPHSADDAGWHKYKHAQRDRWDSRKQEWVQIDLHAVRARSVAIRRHPLGEGAERFVFKLREIDADGNFVGPEMVAKESRFYEDLKNKDHKDTLLSVWADTQQRAAELAEAFNRRIDAIPQHRESVWFPRIKFLECSVYTVWDHRDDRDRWLLAEHLLNTTDYKKWNNNAGFVNEDSTNMKKTGTADRRRAPTTAVHTLRAATVRFPTTLHGPVALPQDRQIALDAIAAGEEEEGSDGDDPEALANTSSRLKIRGISDLGPSELAQAFSHFTFMYSKRKFLVCDLQGVQESGYPPVFVFTDPVIHCASATRGTYGRTDHGKEGHRKFFRTHKCNSLCDLLAQGFDERRRWMSLSSRECQAKMMDLVR